MKKDVLSWIRSNIEPVEGTYEGRTYRASVRLRDGVVLPCVLFCPVKPRLELALRRFEELRQMSVQPGYIGYPQVVKSFVCAGSRIAEHEIEDVWESEYSIPVARLREIEGETSMSWTAFTGVMDDGVEFSFGTPFEAMFFAMPEGYSAKRIVRIIPHKNDATPVYRDKPFFRCYLDYDE